jgi:hypothetical protein
MDIFFVLLLIPVGESNFVFCLSFDFRQNEQGF